MHFERITRPRGASQAMMLKAAELAARARSPFADPGWHLTWGLSHIGIWSWEKDRLRSLGVPQGGGVLPESLLDAPPAADGYRLLVRQEGYEGQIWASGELAASRFWAARPDEEEIAVFRRSVAHSGGPPPSELPGPSLSRADLAVRQAIASGALRPVHMATVVSAILLVPLLFMAGGYLRTAIELDAVRTAQAAFAEAGADQYQALELYRNRAQRLAVYRRELDVPNPLAAAVDMAEVAVGMNARISAFRIEPERLSARFTEAANLEPAELVRALEGRETLRDVRLSRPGNTPGWDIEAQVVPAHAGRN